MGLILILILLIIAIFLIYEFNKFVTLRNKLRQSKSTIEVYLNQRFDLIPNLVEVVKGYAKYEETVLSKIAELRQAYDADKNKDLDKASEINHECNKLFAVAENNPDLKGSEQFSNLQKSLSKIENNLQAARRLYNANITLYNTTLDSFPSNIVASMFGFKQEKLFEIEEYKKENIQLDI